MKEVELMFEQGQFAGVKWQVDYNYFRNLKMMY